MKKKSSSISSSSFDSDDMYIDDNLSKKPVGKSSRKNIGKSMKDSGSAPDLKREEYHQKEKQMKDRIHVLEQEVIKLQLQNNLLTATTPSSG